jgi:hypothetical protein
METGIIKLGPELLALIGTGGVDALAPFTREIYLLDVVVAGTTFCKELDTLEPLLLPETVLRMIRQPKNEHDEMAIGIYHQQIRLGWVPREHNEVISRLMDAGKAFFCRVQHAKRKGEWLKVDVRIYMVE